MKLARVIGKVVLSKCIAPYEGKSLHMVQDLNEELEAVGAPEVSAAWRAVRRGELVLVETAREACNAFEPQVPLDSVILGKVEEVHIERET